MPGNSKRQGATRKRQRGNPPATSGARGKRRLEGRGPTPKAADREGHKAHRAVRAPERKRQPSRSSVSRRGSAGDWVAGRNAVLEALQAGVPVTTFYIADHAERDDRLRDSFRLAADRGISMLQVGSAELDRLTDRAAHQGVALRIPSFDYAEPATLIEHAADRGEPPLIVVLDSVTDPRNLGAVVRSAAAFGAHGVVIPERRAAGMTASAWKTSAGAAARLPVARATNLHRQLRAYAAAGLMIAGLDVDGTDDITGLELATGPLVVVVGSEGKGLSRLVRQTCDVLTRIPTAAAVESLNAGVAAGIALYEISRLRRAPAAGRR